MAHCSYWKTQHPISRREFVARTVAGTAAVSLGLPLLGGEENGKKEKTKRSAVDKVTLGNSKVTVTRLGIGTGSNGGKVQRDLGQEGFNRLVRHAYDRGIRFIDTADMYKIHEMVREAIKGLPREELFIQSKIMWEPFIPKSITEVLDRFRKELGVEYLDHVLIHCATKKGWPGTLESMRDGLSAAKEKGIVRAHGVSCHGLPSLQEVADCKWVDVNLARCNHLGLHMDGEKGAWSEGGNKSEAINQLKRIHAAGKGVIGMKIIGNGDFTKPEEREQSIQFAMKAPFLDAVVIGVKSPQEIDEAIERMDRALNA